MSGITPTSIISNELIIWMSVTGLKFSVAGYNLDHWLVNYLPCWSVTILALLSNQQKTPDRYSNALIATVSSQMPSCKRIYHQEVELFFKSEKNILFKNNKKQ